MAGGPVHVLTRQACSRRGLGRQIHDAVKPYPVLDDVIQRGLNDHGVVFQVTDSDVAARTQDPARAPSAAPLPRVTAPMVMVDVPALAAGFGCTADCASPFLRSESLVEFSDRQSVPLQVERSRVLGVLLPVDLPSFPLVVGMARTAVRVSRTTEVTRRFLSLTPPAGSDREISQAGFSFSRRRLPRVFRRTETGRGSRSACLVLERMIAVLAGTYLDCHNSSIHETLGGCTRESYSRSVTGRLGERSFSANRENCWDTRVTGPHHNVTRKREREGSRSGPQGQSAAEPACSGDGKVQRLCTWHPMRVKI